MTRVMSMAGPTAPIALHHLIRRVEHASENEPMHLNAHQKHTSHAVVADDIGDTFQRSMLMKHINILFPHDA